MWGSTGLTSAWLLGNHFLGNQPNYELNNPELRLALAYGLPTIAVLASGVYQKYVKKKDLESIIQPAIENKELSVGIFNLIYTMPFLLSADPKVNQISNLASNLIMTYGIHFTLDHLNKFKPPYIKNFLNWIDLLFKIKKNENDLDRCEELINSTNYLQNKEESYSLLANIEMSKKQPDFEKAINYELKALENLETKPNLIQQFSHYLTEFLRLILPIKKDNLEIAMGALRSSQTKSFITNINKFVEKKPSIGSKSLRVFSLEKVNSSRLKTEQVETELKQSWESLLEEMLNTPNTQESFQTIEGKPVYTINLYDFMKQMLVLKEGNYEELKYEQENLLKIKEQGIGVVEPIKIVEYDSKFFLAQKYANGELVSTAFERTKNLDLIKTILELTKKIHDLFPKKNENNSLKKTVHKILKSKLPTTLKSLLIKDLSVVYKYSSKISVFDCDAHLDNFILSNDQIIVLDKPSRGYIYPEEDYAKLIDRNEIYNNEQEKFEDLSSFCGEKTAISTFALTTPKALTYAIYEMKFKLKHSLTFLRNAIKNIEYLQNNYDSLYSLKELARLINLRKNLVEVQSIVA